MKLNLNFDYENTDYDVVIRTTGKYSKVSIETRNKRSENFDKKQQSNKKNKYWQTAKA